MTWHLGIRIHQLPDRIELEQNDFLQTILDEFPNLPMKDVPMRPGVVLSPTEVVEGEGEGSMKSGKEKEGENRGSKKKMSSTSGSSSDMSNFPYQSLCGKLRYLTVTRYDIEYALNQLCKFQENPSEVHINAMKYLLGYLRKFPKFSLIYNKSDGEHEEDFRVEGKADSSFADCKEMRRSTYGFVVTVNGMPVVWKSRRTPEVATGTVPAEYYAMNYLTRSVVFVRRILETLGLPYHGASIIESDNKGAIDTIKTRRLTDHTKHLEAYFYFVKEKYQAGVVEPRWIPSENNFADIFTKPLSKVIFGRLLEQACLEGKHKRSDGRSSNH